MDSGRRPHRDLPHPDGHDEHARQTDVCRRVVDLRAHVHESDFEDVSSFPAVFSNHAFPSIRAFVFIVSCSFVGERTGRELEKN